MLGGGSPAPGRTGALPTRRLRVFTSAGRSTPHTSATVGSSRWRCSGPKPGAASNTSRAVAVLQRHLRRRQRPLVVVRDHIIRHGRLHLVATRRPLHGHLLPAIQDGIEQRQHRSRYDAISNNLLARPAAVHRADDHFCADTRSTVVQHVATADPLASVQRRFEACLSAVLGTNRRDGCHLTVEWS